MVFRSHIKMNETPQSKSISPNMASPTTVVVKSLTTQKPLHNFSLPDLKWAMNHTNTNRFRKPSESSFKLLQNSTISDKSKDKLTHHNHNQNKSKNLVGLKAGDALEKLAKRKSFGDDEARKLVKKPAAAAGAGSSSGDGSRSKIYIRIKTKSSKVTDEVTNAGDHNSVIPNDDSDDLLVPKAWNFRPRRLGIKINHDDSNNNVNEGGALKIGGGTAPEIKAPDKKEKEKGKEKDKEEEEEEDKDKGKEKEKEKETIKKEKMKFSISLKKEEIEDDYFVMTGKPPRRPKKRAKNVQKQLDYVFPGMWLASITPDSYKVKDGTKSLRIR